MKFAILIVLVCPLVLGGCLNEQQMGELKQESAALTENVNTWQVEKEEILRLAREEVAFLVADLRATQDDEEARRLALAIETKTAQAEGWVASLDTKINKGVEIVNTINDKVQSAEDGWGLLEMVAGVAAGFFPALGIAVPIIRTARGTARRWQGNFGTLVGAVERAKKTDVPGTSFEVSKAELRNELIARGLFDTVEGLRD